MKLFREAEAGLPSLTDVLTELAQRHKRGDVHIQVDHIQTIEKRPDLRLELSNLQTLCSTCHSRKTLNESVR